jgi:predicted CXXCH cytochrome family protein
MNTTQRIVSIGGSDFPQVIHRDPVGDLAGGNFAYILGTKGSGASDSKGHNVIDIGNIDDTLTAPPGQWHDHQIRNTNFTCAGARGCHGTRGPSLSSGLRNMGGTHHNNVDGKLNTANNVYDSYRFLLGVQGLENPGASRWQNWSATDHNEYFGKSFPLSGGSCNNCHIVGPSNIVSPASRTISGFCGTCHGNFHWLDDPNSVDGGIGGDTISPFTRHPTDIVLPNSGEYASYTTYSVEAPIARQVVPDNPSNTVTPGTDVVMCLSCHAAHATDNPDMLRWDYATMIAGGGGSGGCFTCHTTKN